MPQNHQVIVTEGDNSKPILPSHLIGVSLYSVAEKGDVEAVKMLLGSGADVAAKDEGGWTALHFAAEGGHTDAVALLLERMQGADVAATDDLFGQTALHLAAEGGHRDVVALLLGRMQGADVAAKDGGDGRRCIWRR